MSAVIRPPAPTREVRTTEVVRLDLGRGVRLRATPCAGGPGWLGLAFAGRHTVADAEGDTAEDVLDALKLRLTEVYADLSLALEALEVDR